MSKQKFEAAKKLIQEKRYSQARALLETIDHPKAIEWIVRLDQMARNQPEAVPEHAGSASPPSTPRRRPKNKQKEPLLQGEYRPRSTDEIKAVPPQRRTSEIPAARDAKPRTQSKPPSGDDRQRKSRSRRLPILLLLLLIIVIGAVAVFVLTNRDDDKPQQIAAATSTEPSAEMTEQASPEVTEETPEVTPGADPGEADINQTALAALSATAAQQLVETQVQQAQNAVSTPTTAPTATQPPVTRAPGAPVPTIDISVTVQLARAFSELEGVDSIEAMNIQPEVAGGGADYIVMAILRVLDGANTQTTADALLQTIRSTLNLSSFNFDLTLKDPSASTQYRWLHTTQAWETGDANISPEVFTSLWSQFDGIIRVDQLEISTQGLGAAGPAYAITAQLTVAAGFNSQQMADTLLQTLMGRLDTPNITFSLNLAVEGGLSTKYEWSAEGGWRTGGS